MNLEKPRQIGEYGDLVVSDVAIDGRYTPLAAGGLFVIDASRHDRPKGADGFSKQDDDTAWSAAVAGDYVETISDAGLFVFRPRKAAAPRSSAGPTGGP